MRLSQTIAGADCRPSIGPGDPEVGSITADSRQVRPGTLFVCVAGGTVDGHDYAERALAAGAAAVIAARVPSVAAGWPDDVPLLLAADPRRALAIAAANLFDRPDERLLLAGVTGTNGKTTVSFLLASIVEAAGVRCGLVGTVGLGLGGELRPATHTTPDAVSLTSILAEMAAEGAKVAALEVSSHALSQERVGGLHFRAAAFTNLTRDHLDYHGDMESYFLAKARLFTERLRGGAVAVINHDDPYGSRLSAMLAAREGDATAGPDAPRDRRAPGMLEGREGDVGLAGHDAPRDSTVRAMSSGRAISVWRFSVSDPACEIFASDVELGAAGIRANVRTPLGALALRSGLIGAHNLQNLLCASGLALALGFSPADVERGLESAAGAPGRLERIGPRAFVDYAHTPDALARVCASLREVAAGRLVLVFGCGGDRDRGKRPLMGEVAGRGADLVIVTSDNPRSEDPAAIVAEILPGLDAAGCARLAERDVGVGVVAGLDRDTSAGVRGAVTGLRCAADVGERTSASDLGRAADTGARSQAAVEAVRAGAGGYVVELDRRAAIDLAVSCLGPDDLLLVAGKGHETTQTLADRTIHFDDREAVAAALARSGGR